MSLVQRRNCIQEKLMKVMPRMWAYRLTVVFIR